MLFLLQTRILKVPSKYCCSHQKIYNWICDEWWCMNRGVISRNILVVPILDKIWKKCTFWNFYIVNLENIGSARALGHTPKWRHCICILCRRSKFYPFWISLRILATRMAPWRVNESEMKWRRETGTSSINCSTARQEATLVTLVSIWETIGWILFSRY